jgi:hypothetical protein
MQDGQPDRAEADHTTFRELDRWDRWRDREGRAHRDGFDQAVTIERVDGDLSAGVLGDHRVVSDVVPVTVRGHDELERPIPLLELLADPGE